MAKDANRAIALAILGIVAILAVIGLVLMVKGGVTGKYVFESGMAQWEPNELCNSIGGKLVGIEGGIDYTAQGPLVAVCNINGQLVRAPIVRPMDWREEYPPE